MKPPDWRYNPTWFVAVCLGLTVIVVALLIVEYLAGRWIPSLFDAGGAVVHLLIGLASGLPDHMQHRREGDGYVRGLLTARIGPLFIGRPGWYTIAALSWGVAALVLHNAVYAGLKWELALGTVLIGFALWHPYRLKLWKRMWELYDTDKEASAPPAEGSPLAPEAR